MVDRKLPWFAYGAICWLCVTIAWVHFANLTHMLDEGAFLAVQSDPNQQDHPALHRILVPLIFKLMPLGFKDRLLPLNFPLDSVQNAFQLILDSLFLIFASLNFIAAVQQRVRSTKDYTILIPWLVFAYVVSFNYILVPNRAQYFPYDFAELFFTATLLRLASASSLSGIAFCAVSFLAAINKETGIFFVLLVVAVGPPDEETSLYRFARGRLPIFCFALVAAFAGKVVAVELAHWLGNAHVEAALFYDQLKENLRQLGNPLFWFVFLTNFGFLWLVPILRRSEITTEEKLGAVLVVLWIVAIFIAGITRGSRVFGPIGLTFAWAVIVSEFRRSAKDRGATVLDPRGRALPLSGQKTAS